MASIESLSSDFIFSSDKDDEEQEQESTLSVADSEPALSEMPEQPVTASNPEGKSSGDPEKDLTVGEIDLEQLSQDFRFTEYFDGERDDVVLPELDRPLQNNTGDFDRFKQSFIREMRDFRDSAVSMTALAVGGLVMSPDSKRKIIVDTQNAIKNELSKNPSLPVDIAKSTITGIMASYGQTPDDLSANPKVVLPRMYKKFLDAPIETAMDLSFIFTAIPKTVQLAKQSVKGVKGVNTARKISMIKSAKEGNLKNAKKMVKDVFDSKNIAMKKEIAKNLEVPGKRHADDLFENSEDIRRMDIRQLEDPSWAGKVGEQFSNKLNAIEYAESRAADLAIREIKDVPVPGNFADGLARRLKEKFLVDDNGRIVKELNKGLFTDEIRYLNSGKPITAGNLKARLDNIDANINWVNPEKRDQGLMVLRDVYRKALRDMSPEFDAVQSRRHDILQKFKNRGNQLKSITKKTGGGERFGKNFFETETEYREMLRILQENPHKAAGAAMADLKQLNAWHAWNGYFQQNADFVPKYIWFDRAQPVPFREKIFAPVQKSYMKNRLYLPQDVVPPLRPPAMTALKGQQAKRKIQEDE
jgi:hypothetical protein